MTDSRTAVWTEIAAAFVLMAVAFFTCFWLIPNNTEPARSELDISPAFFPVIAAGLVFGLALVMIVVRLSRHVVPSVELPGTVILTEITVWVGVGLAIWFALPAFGFILVSVLVVALGGLATGYHNRLNLITFAIIFSITVDFGVWQIFTVELP